jgi:ribosomal protein L3 glutamine methyltransferase
LATRIELYEGDLFAPLGDKRYDLILTNPPYVDEIAMEELPEEYRHEPEMALASGLDGLDIVRRILDTVADYLNPGGGLLCEIGAGREIIEAEYPALDFFWLDTEESIGEVFWLTAESLGVVDTDAEEQDLDDLESLDELDGDAPEDV